jgi:ribosomal biogenesis protein LAS1
MTTRDTSLRTRYKLDINAVLRDIERWVAEAKVAANVIASGFAWDIGSSDVGDLDMKEKWALDRLCDGLLAKGGLVPLSKKCIFSLWRISFHH